MALDASIPLQFRPPEVEDPMQAYGRMLSLRSMQAQEQQRQQMAPLLYQREQQEVAAAQRQAGLSAAIAQAHQYAQGDPAAAAASPSGSSPSAAPTEATPAPSATLQSASSLQSTPAPGTNDLSYAGDNDPYSSSNPQGAAAPAVPVAASAAPAAVPPKPAPAAFTPQPSYGDRFTQKMNELGYGAEAPSALQARAVSEEAQIKRDNLRRDQNDEEIDGRAYNEAKGDPQQTLILAAKYGMSQHGLALARANIAAQVSALTKQHEADADLGIKNITLAKDQRAELRDRYTAFLQRPDDDSPEGMRANWDNFNNQNYADKQLTGITDAQHTALMRNTSDFPGKEVLTQWRNRLTTDTQSRADAQAALEQTKAEQERQQAVVTKLVAATNPGQYNKVLSDNNVAPGTYPDASQAFDADGKPIPAMMTTINRTGMTPEQRAMADKAAATAEATAGYRKATLANAGAHLKIAQDKANKDTAAEAKQNIENLAREVLAAHDGNIDYAIRDVNDPKYYKDHPIGKLNVRGGVSQVLERIKTQHGQQEHTAVGTAKTQEQIDHDAGVNDLRNVFGIAKPTTPTAAAKTNAAPAATQPPPPKSVSDPLPPGTHTFQNGQTWRKNADGTMSFVGSAQLIAK